MAEKGNTTQKKHTLSLVARGCASIAGVTRVESFDEHSVLLQTDCGNLAVEGEGLHVGTLDIAHGVVEITGSVNAISYQDATPKKRGWFSRLFG